ncbi:hypothetical protein BRARA_A01987 [Brassica rapa]|uniref:Plant thionin family protein n=1 Tax=Brassica campestris TaxID=3711 RepID=A0A398AUH1_BRACM|nr:uncharacterized protein LOC103871185 [Brassica rapa]RID79230.1 hypothetical protein BRARA_A01987 [Brassica rapa]CAG7888164.1 unnamed protein product [Brassica rapa]VDC75617.1 unnamed protein product [Brassica rapa]
MAAQVLNKTYRAFMILTLFTMICSIQVSDSIPRDVCIKDCVINQCMKASKKTTPAICDNPCKIICDPMNNERYITPRQGYRNPVKRFCETFGWICQ